ncbi:MAG: TAXI family TRAP transporter solute-binding subunit [Thermodesulfobacteriota bacterium]
MNRAFLGLAIAALLTAPVAAPSAARADAKPSVKPFMLATAGTGGTYYILGGAISEVMRKQAGAKVTPLTTNGSIENCRLVSSNRAGVGFSTPDLAYYAYHGQEMFKQGKLENLRYVAGGHFSHAQVVVPKKSSIQTIADLKGKKVAVGAQGSAVLSWSMDVLAVAGLTLQDVSPQYLSMSEMTGALKDGTVDAAIYGAGVPTSSVTNVFAENPMRLLPLEAAAVDAWLAAQGAEKKALIETYTIPAKTYRDQDEDVATMSWRACLLASTSTPDDTVYALLKTIEGFQKDLAAVHPSGAEYTLQNLKAGATIPLHPGAQKFYQEMGIQ